MDLASRFQLACFNQSDVELIPIHFSVDQKSTNDTSFEEEKRQFYSNLMLDG